MTKANPELLIATRNPGKLLEASLMLADLPYKLRTLAEYQDANSVEETGATFAENAALKAQSYAARVGLCALADDSGLAVDFLDGAPGVLSARYSGPTASDADRVSLLLAHLANAPEDQRTARFISAVALADSHGKLIFAAEGVCEGTIISRPRGEGGFGYDPIFIPIGYAQTLAELSLEVKNRISHRAQAFEAVRRFLVTNQTILHDQVLDSQS
jgi:XTP/dITP diphosphohydrolase